MQQCPTFFLIPLGISASWQWWKRIPYLPWYFEIIIPTCCNANWVGSSGNPINNDNLALATIWSQEQKHRSVCLCQCTVYKAVLTIVTLCIPETHRLKPSVIPETNGQFRSYSLVSQLTPWKTMEGTANCYCLVPFISPFPFPTKLFPQIYKNVALCITV